MKTYQGYLNNWILLPHTNCEPWFFLKGRCSLSLLMEVKGHMRSLEVIVLHLVLHLVNMTHRFVNRFCLFCSFKNPWVCLILDDFITSLFFHTMWLSISSFNLCIHVFLGWVIMSDNSATSCALGAPSLSMCLQLNSRQELKCLQYVW